MTIYEQLLSTLSDHVGTLQTAADIWRRVVEAFDTNPTSVIPSDYCYNHLNLGVPDPKPLFLRVGTGEYQFVGLDTPRPASRAIGESGNMTQREYGRRMPRTTSAMCRRCGRSGGAHSRGGAT